MIGGWFLLELEQSRELMIAFLSAFGHAYLASLECCLLKVSVCHCIVSPAILQWLSPQLKRPSKRVHEKKREHKVSLDIYHVSCKLITLIILSLTFSKINVYCGHRLITTSYSIRESFILSYMSSAKGDVE